LKSIRVIVPNSPGILAEIAECLGSRGIGIQHIVAETQGSGAVVRMDVEHEDDALKVLTSAGYHAVTDDVLLARIEDLPGALANVSRLLADDHINIRSLHHVRREDGYALIAISTDDNVRARTVLGKDAL
jgi:hypothetical protein